jgi:hypothetical protein
MVCKGHERVLPSRTVMSLCRPDTFQYSRSSRSSRIWSGLSSISTAMGRSEFIVKGGNVLETDMIEQLSKVSGFKVIRAQDQGITMDTTTL